MSITHFFYTLCSREVESRSCLNANSNEKNTLLNDVCSIQNVPTQTIKDSYKRYRFKMVVPHNGEFHKKVMLKTKLVDFSNEKKLRTLAINKDSRSLSDTSIYETTLICKKNKINDFSKLAVISELLINDQKKYSTVSSINDEHNHGLTFLKLNTIEEKVIDN